MLTPLSTNATAREQEPAVPASTGGERTEASAYMDTLPQQLSRLSNVLRRQVQSLILPGQPCEDAESAGWRAPRARLQHEADRQPI